MVLILSILLLCLLFLKNEAFLRLLLPLAIIAIILSNTTLGHLYKTFALSLIILFSVISISLQYGFRLRMKSEMKISLLSSKHILILISLVLMVLGLVIKYSELFQQEMQFASVQSVNGSAMFVLAMVSLLSTLFLSLNKEEQ